MNFLKQKKIILFRPVNGLNDTLCAIEKLCRYAERTDRVVVVESDYINAPAWKLPLSRYLVSRQLGLVFLSEPQTFEGKSVYPSVLNDLSATYDCEYDAQLNVFVESHSRAPLTFDFSKTYREDILVHQTGGGGWDSLLAMQRMRLHDSVVDLILERLKIIGSEYIGFHARNTDYVSDWEQYVELFKCLDYSGAFLICSDSSLVIEKFREKLDTRKMYNFSSNFSNPGCTPVHFLEEVDDVNQRNIDCFADLVMLALSKIFFAASLKINAENPKGNAVSGYSELARALNRDRGLIESFISRKSGYINFINPSW